MTIDATNLLVVCMGLWAGNELSMALSTLCVIVLFPAHCPSFATVHLVTAQTTHAAFEIAGALGLRRAVVVQTRETPVGKESQAVVVLRNGNLVETDTWIFVDCVAPDVFVMTASARFQDSFSVQILLGVQ